MSDTTSLGDAIDRLIATVDARAGESADTSYTAKLLAKGASKCAQKVGEEAVELAIAAVSEGREHTVKEAADLLYHLIVLLKGAGVSPADIASELIRREGVSGLAEKASRKD